jgi:hypothetical protein
MLQTLRLPGEFEKIIVQLDEFERVKFIFFGKIIISLIFFLMNF